MGTTNSSGDTKEHEKMSASQRLADATVRIADANGIGVGSGFHFLKNDIIVSNAHVVGDLITNKAAMTAHAEDGRKWQLKLLEHSPAAEYDFAVMSATGDNFEKREFLLQDTSEIVRGLPIIYAGYPHGLEPLLAFPSVIGAPLKGREFYFDGMIHGGNSGGPITDETGKRLIGIVTARRFLGDPEMQAVDKEMSELAAYLNGVAGQGRVVLMGVSFTDFASALSRIALLTNELIRRNSTTGIGVGLGTSELIKKAKELKLL